MIPYSQIFPNNLVKKKDKKETIEEKLFRCKSMCELAAINANHPPLKTKVCYISCYAKILDEKLK